MPFLPDTTERLVSQFNGPILNVDPYSVQAENALLAQNIEYLPKGEIKTRFGHSQVWNPADAASSMANWIFIYLGNKLNYLVYFKPGVGVRFAPVPTPSATTIMAQATAAGAVFAPAGQQLYAAFYNSAGQGAAAGQVYSIAGGADPLFKRAPLTTEVVVSFTEGGASSGTITAGLHRVGFYLTTANGYTTRLAPLNSGITFVPQNFTASGDRNVTVTLTPAGGYNWPTGASVTVVMTTVTNLQKYLTVPTAPPTSVAGALPVNITFDITDEDLAASGTDVTLQQTVMSQDGSGNPPFTLAFLAPYGERMAYTGVDAAGIPVTYFSEPSAFQSVTAAQHGVYLPGNLPQTCGFSLRGVYYLLGPHWTYSVSDSGGVPATWAAPQLVDGTIGALGPFCVWLNAAHGFCWVADVGGLYLFSGGQYPARPVSYYQTPDWQRINFGAPTQIFVVDDKDKKRVRVIAPLDGATTPTHILNFYYLEGTDPEQIKYSLDPYAPGPATLVENDSTKSMEVWYGSSSAGPVVRANNGSEANPYRDAGSPINSIYRMGQMPGAQSQGTVLFHHADELRVLGSGNLALKVYSLDQVKNVVPAKSPLALSTTPGRKALVRYSLMSEQAILELSTNALDAWFQLSEVAHYYTLGPLQR